MFPDWFWPKIVVLKCKRWANVNTFPITILEY